MNTDYVMDLQSKTLERLKEICKRCPKSNQCTLTECDDYQEMESDVMKEL